MKIWYDDGVACVVQSKLSDKFKNISNREIDLMHALCSAIGMKVISLLDSNRLISKDELISKSGVSINELDSLLLKLIENMIVEYVFSHRRDRGISFLSITE